MEQYDLRTYQPDHELLESKQLELEELLQHPQKGIEPDAMVNDEVDLKALIQESSQALQIIVT